MGEARRRGTREERVKQAIEAGRKKHWTKEANRLPFVPDIELASLVTAIALRNRNKRKKK